MEEQFGKINILLYFLMPLSSLLDPNLANAKNISTALSDKEKGSRSFKRVRTRKQCWHIYVKS